MNAFEKEAKEKWGQVQAYKEYEEKQRNRQELDALATGMEHILAEFATCMQKGELADSDQAQSLVKSLQDYISDHYYRCTTQILSGLGRMYVADQRFQHNIDTHAEGTAAFISQAIAIYCRQ